MGLGSYWGEVLDVLREIIPVYDKVNSAISLGKDVEHRTRGIKDRVLPGNKVLDAGSGFGNMSKTAMGLCKNDLSLTLYDLMNSFCALPLFCIHSLKSSAGSYWLEIPVNGINNQ